MEEKHQAKEKAWEKETQLEREEWRREREELHGQVSELEHIAQSAEDENKVLRS